MSPAGPRVRGAAAVVALFAFVLGASATQRMRDPNRRADSPQEPPILTMHTERLGEDGKRCDGGVVVSRGKAPEQRRPIVRLKVVASRPVPMAYFEQALRERAAQHCAAGVAIANATASADPRRLTEVVALAYASERVTSAESPPVTARESVDAGAMPDAGAPARQGPAPF